MEPVDVSKNLKDQLIEYCEKYDVPLEYLVDIISDQKVLPMIRGKGVEYNMFALLSKMLNPDEWKVEKRNLNPQPNQIDEDIVVIHKKSGKELILECKSAVRASFRMRTRNLDKPHFRVKCHKSRSYIGKKTNDRYFAHEFDIVISNPSNSIIKKGKDFAVIEDPEAIKYFEALYNVKGSEDIFKSSCKDWRFAISKDIANTDGTIPRTPLELFENDLVWKPLKIIEKSLNVVLKTKM